MLVLKLSDGSPYVFPTITEMKADMDDMTRDVGSDKVGSLLPGLQGVVRSGGTAEVARMRYLQKVVTLRLKAIQGATTVPNVGVNTTLAQATSNTAASQAALDPINKFLIASSADKAVADVDDSAAGVQSFDTLRLKAESDRLDLDRATFLDGRNRFWKRELETAQSWLSARISYLNTKFGVTG